MEKRKSGNHRSRTRECIPVEVFEAWYENQIMYQKADKMSTLMDLEADYISLQDAAELLGITREQFSIVSKCTECISGEKRAGKEPGC